MNRTSRSLLATLALACLAAGHRAGADWPTYRADARRSGYTSESLPAKLAPRWTRPARHQPRPAWSGRDTRMPFDRAYHTVVADGRLFYGSSADGKIYALDAASGAELWTFFTGAPVRFPPAAWKDRLFATSDDGFLYCLAAADGRLLWKLRGGPNDDMIVGNDRITSRWPARGGPAVADGIVYFGAGIWPSEGIYLYAVDAETGKVLWCNDESGDLYMPQPHGGANARSGVSAQGNLVVAGDVLLVPTGRAVPAALERTDGELLYFHLQANRSHGGSEVVAAERGVFFNRGAAFDVPSGAPSRGIPALPPNLVALAPDRVIHWHEESVRVARWTERQTRDRKGKPVRVEGLDEARATPTPYGGTSLVVVGNTALSAGPGAEGYGVTAVDLAGERPTWSEPVDGVPWGLAVADGRLYVSTEQGTIYCFGDAATAASTTPLEPPEAIAPAAADSQAGIFAGAAEAIMRETGVREGYCVDLGCGRGELARALAERTGLHVVAIDPDPQNVAAARSMLDAAGLYGVRVTVHQGDPTKSPYPSGFANLVVSGRTLAEGATSVLAEEAARIARPYGGVCCIGKPGAWKTTVRGPLEGAGAWTHQYCDPANTNCSTDTVARGPLGVLWFTDLDFPMPSRHGRGRAPLFLDGRLFIEGLNGLLCVDAYNGRKLWEYPLPEIQDAYDGEHLMGTSGTGGNLCIGRHGLYVHTGPKCLRIDPADGKLLAQFPPPDQPDGERGTWGVVACVGDTLLGTLANRQHVVTYRYGRGDMQTQFTESLLLFALDARTGELKWRYRPEHSIRHNALAVGDGRVHLIDRPLATGDRHREKRRGQPDPGDVHPTGTLVALELQSGDVLWKTADDVYGTLLALSPEHDTLLMAYQDWRFKLASERGGRMAAFDAVTGRRRWDLEADYRTRPILNGRTVYIEPGAWDLVTGEKKSFRFERSYGCGIPAVSKHLIVFRSATLGYVDLTEGPETRNYGGIRPGCWINTLPAGGLVLMPDATDRCTCSYLIKASIALQPREPRN